MLELPHHAKHDPWICGAPGLFRSLKRGSRETPLEIGYEFGSATLNYKSRVLLGCDDLRVLQGIMALASSSECSIDAESSNESSRDLHSGLDLKGAVADASALLVETSFARLALVSGYADTGGAMGTQVRASLERLSGCSVECFTEKTVSGWRLLSWDTKGSGRNRLRIALNPRSSHCARGQKSMRYTWIDMDEARSLPDDVSRLCHQRLSNWIDAIPRQRADSNSDHKRVHLKKLWEYAWADEPNAPSAAAARQRRATLRAAIEALKKIGWKVDETDVGSRKYDIVRPTRIRGRLSVASPAGVAAHL